MGSAQLEEPGSSLGHSVLGLGQGAARQGAARIRPFSNTPDPPDRNSCNKPAFRNTAGPPGVTVLRVPLPQRRWSCVRICRKWPYLAGLAPW